MAEMTRKKIRWATKKRKGASRKWKTRWIMVPKQENKKETAAAAAAAKKA